jgi:non-ribosomal peptide synthetase component E (peptide arylation enzyme)
MTARSLFDLLREPVAHRAQEIAIVAPDGQEITYGRIGQTITRFAAKAREHGVEPRQIVAINLTHPAALLCMVVALSRIGAVAAIGDQARRMTEAGVKLNAVISDSMDYGSDPLAIRFDQSWAATGDEAVDLAQEAAWVPS